MPDISPFCGWRYNVSQVGDLSDVTCPPYDVIDAGQQDALYKRHPCNVIRLELNRTEPGDASDSDRYRRAAGYWKHWRLDGVLQQDSEDALYVYHQTFRWENETYTRKGFVARLRLEPFGTGQVFPHEQTLSGPKADRLALFQACRANLSPIFGLYPDSEQAVQQQLDDACISLTPAQATDDLGVTHRLWPMTDNRLIGQIRAALRGKPVFIADGHHRYETGLNYLRELQSKGPVEESDPANFVMMHFVGMDDPGLQILPTHRLISGLPILTTQELKHLLDPYFQLEFIGAGPQAAKDCWELIEVDESQNLFGFGSVADGGWLWGRLVDDSLMASLAPEHTADWRELAVSRLHCLVIDHLLRQRFPDHVPQLKFVHQVSEVSDALRLEQAQIGCLVPPASIEHVELIASHRETMPPKSTYFYPKLLTGMVFHALDM